MTTDDELSAHADQALLYRIVDANRNRCLEGLRVVEDHLRFVWEDPHLMAQCKQLRHDVVQVLARLPQADLSAARDVQQDVGRTVKTEAEFERADLAAVLAANWQRVQQALRGLEEFTKVIAPDTARQLETLRYRAYVLDRAVSIQHDSVVRLADARLYVLVDGRSSSAEFGELVAQLIEGGVDVLQLRDKTLPDRSLLERARILRTLTRGQRVLFIMNDRVDLALMADADGVHVGQDEVTVQDARRLLGSRALIGVSTHNLEQARQAVLDGANYLGCGPTFPSSTKPFERYPGLDLVAQISVDIRLPAFAIGGIDLQNVGEVCAAGLRRVAVSHSVIGAADPRRAAQQLKGVLFAAEGAGREATGPARTRADRDPGPIPDRAPRDYHAPMRYEVENKFPVEQLDVIAQQLAARGAEFGEVIEQVDYYFAHPARDFARTDEALRIRRCGEQNLVTYKGPKIDQATKTRQELELPLAPGAERAEQYVQLLLALGFRRVADVHKRRRLGRFRWQQWSVEATLDAVDGLGSFVELEIQAVRESLPEAQASLLALATNLGLTQVERRSYLEMLLQSHSPA